MKFAQMKSVTILAEESLRQRIVEKLQVSGILDYCIVECSDRGPSAGSTLETGKRHVKIDAVGESDAVKKLAHELVQGDFQSPSVRVVMSPVAVTPLYNNGEDESLPTRRQEVAWALDLLTI
jgi:hypothetical protein